MYDSLIDSLSLVSDKELKQISQQVAELYIKTKNKQEQIYEKHREVYQYVLDKEEQEDEWPQPNHMQKIRFEFKEEQVNPQIKKGSVLDFLNV